MKKKKIICPRLDWNQGPHDSQAAIHTPRPEEAVINRYNFINIYITRLMKRDRKSFWLQPRLEPGTPGSQVAIYTPRPEEAIIDIYNFIEIYITLFPK